MSTVQVQTTINAPVQRVWDTIMDPSRLGDWVTIHKSLSQTPRMPLQRGASMEQVLSLRGVSFRVQWTLVEVNPPTTAEWEGRGPAHSSAFIRYQLSPDGENATQFQYTNEFKPPGGMLGVMASRVIVGAASEREANNSLARLKSLLER